MVASLATSSGSEQYVDYVPSHDAAPVAALRQGGAIPFAKTNLPRFAADVQTYNRVFGTSNNPWDSSRSVGGSSGGSAGALAAGFSAIEIGSDIAGSIRNPAGSCGVVGHKPSYGIVPAQGQIPGPPGTLTLADIAVVGPMARTVADCELLLDLMVGPGPWLESAWSLELPSAGFSSVADLRVAVWSDDGYCRVDPEIVSAITRVGEDLAALGASVDYDVRPQGFDFAKADLIFTQLLGAAMSGGWSLAELESMASEVEAGMPLQGDLGVQWAHIRHRGWLSANERRLQMRQSWQEFFTNWDVLLAPISPTVAIPHDHSKPFSERVIDVAGSERPYHCLMQWMGLFGVSLLPATAVPVGLHSSGLPIGLQVVGPFLGDKAALAAARIIEGLDQCGFQRPPNW